LHFAVDSNKQQLVEYLLQLNINLNSEDYLGLTPLDYANICQYFPLISLLEAHGARKGRYIKSQTTKLSKV
jgi:ankyrin repeat protein